MADKEFKTIKQQISLLESRGLQIPDKVIATNFLLHNNYDRISGYSLTLRKNDKFVPNITFQNIIDIYEFDQYLRHILLRYIEIIEISFKSIYSYEFTNKFGPNGHYDSKNFNDNSIYKELMNKAKYQKKLCLRNESYLQNFDEKLIKNIPFWSFIELFTISNLSHLYKISKKDIKLKVANRFGIQIQGEVLLEQFMHNIAIIRNLCAHGSRLYNRLFEQKPKLNKQEKSLLIINSDGTIDNEHLYSFILIMRRLLNSNDFIELKKEISALSKKYPFVKLRYYGFREDWEDVL